MLEFLKQPDTVTESTPYLDFLGLNQNPFPVAPDNLNFYISEHIDQILSNLVHGIVSRKGFMVLTGDIGLGKTTISRRIINILEDKRVETSLVFHTTYQDVELLKEINRDFGLESNSRSYSDQMKLLAQFLLDQNRRGRNCAIIIDDAQNLSRMSLELVRMISNLEADQQKLVQIILIGQPELMDKLNSHELRQLKSRIMISEEVNPLTLDELKTYLLFKLNGSGNKGLVEIHRSAFKKIHRLTAGNFRQVNILLDRCLYVAFFYNSIRISKQIVAEAYQDLQPRKFSALRRRSALIAAAAAATVLITAGTLYFSSVLKLSGMSSIKPTASPTPASSEVQALAEKAVPNMDAQLQPAASVIDAPAADSLEEPPTTIPRAIANFLNTYSLSQYANAFYDALRYRQFARVAEDISYDTRYELVRLDRVPEFVRGKFGILAYPMRSDGQETFFLFWRPVMRLKKFYYSYRDHNISLLQEKLAQLNLYDHRIDGIVGPRLMSAVVRFQKDLKLPVTGYPDDKTIFLICQLAESSQESPAVHR